MPEPKAIRQPVNLGAVEALRELLARAETGEIAGFVFVGICPGRVHLIGRHGDVDERDLALALVDLGRDLADRRRGRGESD